MKNIKQLNDWQDDVRSGLRREIGRLREKEEMLNSYMQLLDATSEFLDDMGSMKRELERSQAEADSLSDELDEQQKENESLLRQMKDEATAQRMEMQAEIDSLRKQLINAKDLCSLRLVTVTGNYNDIHHNERVNGEGLMVKG